MEPRAWAVQRLRFYRPLGFFQSKVDEGEVTGEEPGYGHVPIGLPRPAWGTLPDEQVADIILTHHAQEWGQAFEPEAEDADLRLVEYDVHRMLRADAECVVPEGEAYADLLLALARIARGALPLSGVREAWPDGRAAEVTFQRAGKPGKVGFTSVDDYVDPELVGKANALMGASPYRFHALDTGDQTILLVALDAGERKKLEAAGWPFL